MCLDSRLKFAYKPQSLEGVSEMCMTMHRVHRPERFECTSCLDSFEPQQEADTCRQNDGGDTFSKVAAYERRQVNEARLQRELIRD